MSWRSVEGIFLAACLFCVSAVVVYRSSRADNRTTALRPVERPLPSTRSPEIMTEPRQELPPPVDTQANDAIIAEVRTVCEMLQDKRMTVKKMAAYLGTMDDKKCDPNGPVDVRPRNPLFAETSVDCPFKGKHPGYVDLHLAKSNLISVAALRHALGDPRYDPIDHLPFAGDGLGFYPDSFTFYIPKQPGGWRECRILADMQWDLRWKMMALEMSDQVWAELKKAGVAEDDIGLARDKELGRRLDGTIDKISVRID